MWPFLLVLAIVPMVFFWSDSVGEMFPQLKTYLPEKSAQAPKARAGLPTEVASGFAQHEVYGRWYVLENETGYVAFTLSADGQYRLSVGCRPKAEAALQVTHLSGSQFPTYRVINYQYGALPLATGYSSSPDVIGAVSQFSDLILEGPSREVYGQFKVAAQDSGLVARSLQSNCIQGAGN